jgi:hypothetical protein
MASTVSQLPTRRVGWMSASGIAPAVRNTASTRNPNTNQGTSDVHRGRAPATSPESVATRPTAATSGPSSMTRPSFTVVATSTLSALTG